MLPWHASVCLVAGVLFAASSGKISSGKMSGKEERFDPDSLAAGLNTLGRDMGSRKGRSTSSFQFTFDVGCQEGVSTVGLDHTKLYSQASSSINYTTRTYTNRVLGLDYQGRANMTVDGEDCLVWPDYTDVGEHNHCRNPGGIGGFHGVWCITSLSPWSAGYCPVPRCTQPILDIPADNEFSQPRASSQVWPAADMPSSWTICSAFMLNDWPRPDSSELTVWTVLGQDIYYFALSISTTESGTIYKATVRSLHPYTTEKVVFPGRWIRSCFSHQKMENNKTRLRLVVDGALIGEENFEEVDHLIPYSYSLVVGQIEFWSGESWNQNLFRGMATDVNMFSSALTMERMVDMTNGQGGENCWIEGDFVSWLKSSWTLEDNATMLQVDKHIHSPCRKENSVNIFNMVGLHRQEDCMRHCQKLGNGRSPPFGTPQQWLSMQSEIEAIASESDDTDDMLTHMWLSVTEGDLGGRLARLPHWPDTEFIEGHGNVPLVAEEDVWRDYYTGERVEFQLPEHAYNVSVSGKEYNCLAAVAEEIGFTSAPFAEFDCLQRHMSCTCEYARDPVVTLRGLCPELYKERAVDSKFIPFQNLSYPRQLHWQGIRHSMLKLDASDKKWRKWRMSSSVYEVGPYQTPHSSPLASGTGCDQSTGQNF